MNSLQIIIHDLSLQMEGNINNNWNLFLTKKPEQRKSLFRFGYVYFFVELSSLIFALYSATLIINKIPIEITPINPSTISVE